MSVLVFCEDNPSIRRLIAAAMRTTPHEVHVAQDGVEGLELVRTVRPAILFADVSMPRMTGYELADAMHADPALASVPVVFVTASVQRDELERARTHHAFGVIAKPFGPAQLREEVERYLASRDAPTPSPG